MGALGVAHWAVLWTTGLQVRGHGVVCMPGVGSISQKLWECGINHRPMVSGRPSASRLSSHEDENGSVQLIRDTRRQLVTEAHWTQRVNPKISSQPLARRHLPPHLTGLW